jgi:replicative DNA helicase
MASPALLDLRPRPEDSEAALALESSQALLGCIMADPTRFREVAHITPDHFGEPYHGRIWAVVADLVSAGREPDPLTLADRLAGDPAFADTGGRGYLFDLWVKSPPAAGVRQFAENVMDGYTRRVGSSMLGEASRALLDSAGRPAASLIGELRHY